MENKKLILYNYFMMFPKAVNVLIATLLVTSVRHHTCTARHGGNNLVIDANIPNPPPVAIPPRPASPVDIEPPTYNQPNAYGQAGLTINSKIDDMTYTARYIKEPIVKCFDVKEYYHREMRALSLIDYNRFRQVGRSMLQGRKSIATYLDSFKVPGGDCIVYNFSGGKTLAEYAQRLSLEQKSRFLPIIFNQVLRGLKYLESIGMAHVFLTPHTVIINHPNMNGAPKATIYEYSYQQQVNFSNGQCQKIRRNIVAHDNYCAPEILPFLRRQPPHPMDACKLDTWNLGVIMLSAMAHQRNIAEGTMNAHEWSRVLQETQEQFGSATSFNDNERHAAIVLRPLLRKVVQLMQTNPEQRPNLASVEALTV
ncbi:kinase-like domain-containing protein [Syncephalis plumigaleata]|nr:kinase-like domain-containing protein [Syncephalis plumigaleata]